MPDPLRERALPLGGSTDHLGLAQGPRGGGAGRAVQGLRSGRERTTSDIARAVVFFAAAQDGFVTGQTPIVDGGGAMG